jgi:hypothetical protein
MTAGRRRWPYREFRPLAHSRRRHLSGPGRAAPAAGCQGCRTKPCPIRLRGTLRDTAVILRTRLTVPYGLPVMFFD